MKRISVPITGICLALSVALCVASAQHDTLITSGKGSYWQTGAITAGTGTATVTVNESSKNQKWIGFGGCFNEKGWEALQKLSAGDRDKAIKLLFGKDGCNFTWGRIPIGASDYGLTRYTLDETAGDTAMTSFSIAHDKDYLIPFIKAAQAVKSDILFWGSAWTPPSWMKNPVGFDGGAMINQPKYLKANALYTAKFCEAYKAEGIPIKFVVPQNEPGYTQAYPSCGWGKYRMPDGKTDVNNAEYLSDYVLNYLVPALQPHPETDIWFGTMSNNNTDWDYWLAVKSKAGSHIKGVCMQWNFRDSVKNLVNTNYLIMQSEHQCGNYPWLSAKATSPDDANANNFLAAYAPNNHAYGQESWNLMSLWIRNGVHSYNAWNMVLDTGGSNLDQTRPWPQNALLSVNYKTSTLHVTPAYYVFRHVSQFLDTGAIRLGTTGGDVLAFKNPNGSYVTVIYNSGTSASQTTVSVGGKTLKISVPAIGWATLCVGLPGTTSIKEIAHNQSAIDASGLKITNKGDGYRIALPSQESGHFELLTATGRVLEARAIQQGSREILFGKQASHAGLLLVRVVYGGKAKTARLFAY
jgi:glucosylceramidase